jgi:hypothetical protein
MKSNNNNNNNDDDDDDDDNNNTAMGSVHARGDTFLNFWFKSAYRNEHLTPRHWYPVPGGIAGTPCLRGHKYRGLVLQVGGWALD